MTDYLAMHSSDAYLECGADATKWAEWFKQVNGDRSPPADVMFSWFANAMMAMSDHVTGDGPVRMPDGSAFCVGEYHRLNFGKLD